MNNLYCLLRGGLGNQLFIFAACFSAAIRNGLNLKLDISHGFKNDKRYRRKFSLGNFTLSKNVDVISANNLRYKNFYYSVKIKKKFGLNPVSYHEATNHQFDQKLYNLSSEYHTLAVGLWQSERYFKDFKGRLRKELNPCVVAPLKVQRLLSEVSDFAVIGVHIRNFGTNSPQFDWELSKKYFSNSIKEIRDKYGSNIPVLAFSNDESFARHLLRDIEATAFISFNEADADFWEMQVLSYCKFFVGSNSTFSWWAAWLNEGKKEAIMFPDVVIEGEADWGFDGLIPQRWSVKKL